MNNAQYNAVKDRSVRNIMIPNGVTLDLKSFALEANNYIPGIIIIENGLTRVEGKKILDHENKFKTSHGIKIFVFGPNAEEEANILVKYLEGGCQNA